MSFFYVEMMVCLKMDPEKIWKWENKEKKSSQRECLIKYEGIIVELGIRNRNSVFRRTLLDMNP